jgi:hypothetical protein
MHLPTDMEDVDLWIDVHKLALRKPAIKAKITGNS